MARFTLLVGNNYAGAKKKIGSIESKLNFEQVVLEGINDIQRLQREQAPVHKRGSIPKSIRAATVHPITDGHSATSKTSRPEAIWTNYGTKGPYTITHHVTGQDFQHPGQKAQYWWDRATLAGFLLAEEAFRHKIENVLGVG